MPGQGPVPMADPSPEEGVQQILLHLEREGFLGAQVQG